jgi:hypothetical protein
MTFNNEKLNENEKVKVINYMTDFTFKEGKYNKKSFSFKKIIKILGHDYDVDAIKGYIQDKKGNPVISRLNTFHTINETFLISNYDSLN